MERIAKQQYISLHHNATTDGVIVPDKERRGLRHSPSTGVEIFVPLYDRSLTGASGHSASGGRNPVTNWSADLPPKADGTPRRLFSFKRNIDIVRRAAGELKNMQKIISLVISTIAFTVIMASAFGQQRPPYVEKNRCPFECCRLGTWVAKSVVRAYVNEGDTTRAAFQVSPNDTIVAEIGNVHMEAVGTILVTKPIHDFNPGDTLIATQCAGEEDYEVWHQGKPYYVDVFWKSLYSPDDYEYDYEAKQPESKFSGTMLSRPLMIWWVRVKNQHGQTGWLRLVNKTLYCFELEEQIEGMDGCS